MEPPNIGNVNVRGLDYQVCNRALNLETVEALLYSGGDVVSSDISGHTPVYYACAAGNIEVLRAIMSRGVDINADCTPDKRKPLHIAAKYGYHDIVEYLLECKAEVTAVDGDGSTALHQVYSKTLSKVLLEHRLFISQMDDYGSTTIHEVYSKNVVKLLLEHGSDIRQMDDYGMTALHRACERGLLPVVRDIVHYGAPIDQVCIRMNTPLHYAVMHNKEDIVRYLLENKANVNSKNEFGVTPLHMSLHHPDKGVVEMLLAHGADFNDIDKSGKMSLHHACLMGFTSAVEMLLQKGASINFMSNDQMTPLHYAVLEGHCETIKLLLERGANINGNNESGMTPFHLACRVGEDKAVDILLRYGVDVNSVSGGKTGLHLACEEGYASVVKLLVENGADVNAVCMEGKTAFDYTRSHYHNVRNNSIDYGSCCEILERQLIKQVCLEYYVCVENMRLVFSSLDVNEFLSSCNNEVLKLQSHILHNKISLYHYLMKNENQLAIYTKNHNIMRVIKECDIKDIYPIYCDMIETNVKKGQRRLTLLKEGEKCLNELLNYKLPLLFTSDLVTYLGNEDLLNLVASCQPNK